MVFGWGRRKEPLDYDAALRALAEAAAQVEAAPLPPEYYPVAHEAFEAASDQRDLLAQALSALIGAPRFRGRENVDFLSVGCGDGLLDAKLIARESAPQVDFVGVDPNPNSIAAFAERRAVSADRLITADFMAWEDERRFDIVSAIHMIYYLDDKRAFLERLLARRKPGGFAAVAIAPFSRMNQIASVFWRGQTEGDFYADDCAALLRDMGVAFDRREIAASMPMVHFGRRTADPLIVDFTVQTELDGLTLAVQDALFNAIEAAAETIDGRKALAHPVDLFLIEA